jgi:hypothetical protein
MEVKIIEVNSMLLQRDHLHGIKIASCIISLVLISPPDSIHHPPLLATQPIMTSYQNSCSHSSAFQQPISLAVAYFNLAQHDFSFNPSLDHK